MLVLEMPAATSSSTAVMASLRLSNNAVTVCIVCIEDVVPCNDMIVSPFERAGSTPPAGVCETLSSRMAHGCRASHQNSATNGSCATERGRDGA